MKYFIFSILCLGTFAVHSQALRLRGESYPGLENVDAKVAASKLYHKAESRIVGGEIAPEAFAPYQVSMQNQYGNHFCGGVIISDDYILTAASCVAGLQKKNVFVITSTNDWMGLAWLYEVDEIFVHCNFDKPLYHNDIALVKLSTKIAYDAQTQNITIADMDLLQEGEKLTMTGWGSWVQGEHYPNELKKLESTYISNEQCKKIYAQYADDVDDGHLCVQPPSGEGACHGDTGGPLVNSKGELVGVGNWGVPCAYGFPDVFARLSFYNDWIRTTIKGCTLPP